MSDIFREVDEALQREKAAHFWKKYGPILVLAALALIIGTGAMTAFRAWNKSANEKETARLITAMESKDMAPALENVAKDARDGQKAVALMNAAARLATLKDFTKASSLYKQVADDSSADMDLRDLSAVLYVQSAQQTNAKPDYAALAQILKNASERQNGAFILQARLESALLYGDGLKDYTQALKMLDGFDAPSVPASLQEKANALKHIYQYENTQALAPAAK